MLTWYNKDIQREEVTKNERNRSLFREAWSNGKGIRKHFRNRKPGYYGRC